MVSCILASMVLSILSFCLIWAVRTLDSRLDYRIRPLSAPNSLTFKELAQAPLTYLTHAYLPHLQKRLSSEVPPLLYYIFILLLYLLYFIWYILHLLYSVFPMSLDFWNKRQIYNKTALKSMKNNKEHIDKWKDWKSLCIMR